MIDSLDVELTYCVSVDIGDLGITDLDDLTDDQVLGLFGIVPDFDLNLMKPNQNLANLTGAIINEVDQILNRAQHDWVLVQGDTTTTMAGALAAFYQHVKVGHVEAGLRTFNLQSPYPEELNRQVTSKLASLHFAPTERSRENLLREGVPDPVPAPARSP